ncbi:MAG TPA: PAS sensor protein [Cyanobacteria bacterium UBA8803]|nr:PAS sensor protein [Cyanobacteria bacterium UBA9273]HBL61432.1 PAS sensor protein [Cyanobacteria bacterium UBA8803]
MSEEQFIQHFQAIHAQLVALHGYVMPLPQRNTEQIAEILAALAASLDNLQMIYEEMQASLAASTVLEEEILQQSEQAVAERQRYYDLFQFAPDAYLLTDANGLILEANAAARKLLNIRQNSLVRMPLASFVPPVERQALRSYLNKMRQLQPVEDLEISLCPRDGKAFAAQLKVTIARDFSGDIAALRIGIRDISQYKQAEGLPLQLLQQQQDEVAQYTTPQVSSLPGSLDGLQVLIVDDETDAREFITAVLESQGIHVTAVATGAEALATLEDFRPDVLVSDIRMPDESGYSLIRKIRQLEGEKGWHIPAAALTAYLAEDREKALSAGFESHLHKLAQPTELVAMVARLAGRV